jgi:hypothetical protein
MKVRTTTTIGRTDKRICNADLASDECEQLLDVMSTVLASGQRMTANPLVEGIRRKNFCINVFTMLSWTHWCMKVWQDRVWQGWQRPIQSEMHGCHQYTEPPSYGQRWCSIFAVAYITLIRFDTFSSCTWRRNKIYYVVSILSVINPDYTNNSLTIER